jgi:hypothetical protein
MFAKVLTIIFWLLATPTGAAALFIVLMTLAGQNLSAATPLWLALVAAVSVLALLGWAYRFLAIRRRPGLACVITVSSWIFFVVTMFGQRPGPARGVPLICGEFFSVSLLS